METFRCFTWLHMPKLIVRLEDGTEEAFELRGGVNTFGRHQGNDFVLDHASVSDHHCVISVGANGMVVRDLDSGGGTFIDGVAIREAAFYEGQLLRLGGVELSWQASEVKVAIPVVEITRQPEAVQLADGAVSCLNHLDVQATRRCTGCARTFCEKCVHRLRRVGGQMHNLCPVCSVECEWIGPTQKPKKTLLAVVKGALGTVFGKSR